MSRSSSHLLPLALASLFLAPVLLAQSPPVSAGTPSGGLVVAQPAPGGGLFGRSETVGPWTLMPPDSASLIAGGGGSWGWLNTVNVAVTVNDAFSGAGIVEDGYANADLGTTIQVDFLAGVVNGTGPDLVLLDAQFDAGAYLVSTDYDGFAASVSPTFVPSGESRNYYYERNSSVNYAAVWGGEVDLSSLGVPAGGVVGSIRFTTTNGAGDPLGMGSLAPAGPLLSVAGLVAGGFATVSVANATPGGLVGVGYSLAGGGPVTVAAGPCGPVTANLSPPFSILPLLVADAVGNASTGSPVPAGTTGVMVWLHGLDLSTCTMTNPLALVIG